MDNFKAVINSLALFRTVPISATKTVDDLVLLLNIYQQAQETRSALMIDQKLVAAALLSIDQSIEHIQRVKNNIEKAYGNQAGDIPGYNQITDIRRAKNKEIQSQLKKLLFLEKKHRERKNVLLLLQKNMTTIEKSNQTIQLKAVNMLRTLRPSLLEFYGYDRVLGYPYGTNKTYPQLETDTKTRLLLAIFDALLLIAKIAPKNTLLLKEEQKIYTIVGYQFNLNDLINFNRKEFTENQDQQYSLWFKSSIPIGLNDAFCSMDVTHIHAEAINRKISACPTLNADTQYALGRSEKLKFTKSQKKASAYFFKAETKNAHTVTVTDELAQTKMRENIYDTFLPEKCLDVLTWSPP